jgi:ribosome recycling factor
MKRLYYVMRFKPPVRCAQMERMEKSLESTKQSFATVRTGRASPAMLDRIQVCSLHAMLMMIDALEAGRPHGTTTQVDYYGAPTPLRQIANLSAPEAGMLVVQPYDKSAIPNIEKAIMASDLGLTPGNDGNLIRINVPQLTAVRMADCFLSVKHWYSSN